MLFAITAHKAGRDIAEMTLFCCFFVPKLEIMAYNNFMNIKSPIIPLVASTKRKLLSVPASALLGLGRTSLLKPYLI